jgi:protein-tyrosine-phosphatase
MRGTQTLDQTPALFKLLAHDIRWHLLTLLVHSDYTGQELVRLLKHPQNLVSYHLRLLAGQQVIRERRNNADERSIYYSLDLERLHSLLAHAGENLHPAFSVTPISSTEHKPSVSSSQPPVRVLFLCTHNSARSQIAEGMMRGLSNGSIEVASAGSDPTSLHPLAVKACAAMGFDISQQRSKAIDELQEQSFDYIVTVCDRVREVCPTWPSEPTCMHWSFPDPSAVQGTEEERYRAFEQTALQLMTRIRYLLILIERDRSEQN